MAKTSLDDLMDLNQEILALARAGIPLDCGLTTLAKELSGGTGRLAETIALRLERGESLQDVVSDETLALPPIYRAVVVAGLRSGDLPSALQALSSTSRRIVDLRRRFVMGLVYPLTVCLLVWYLYWLKPGASWQVAMEDLHHDILTQRRQEIGALAKWSAGMHTWIRPWAVWLPLGVLVPASLWLSMTKSSHWLGERWSFDPMSWLPGVGRWLQYQRWVIFCEMLSLLIGQKVPLGEALHLAAEACGDRKLKDSVNNVHQRLQAGDTRLKLSDGLPPLLTWLLSSGRHGEDLAGALSYAARAYRQRANDIWRRLYFWWPTLMTLLIGGGVLVFYALAVFIPFTTLLQFLAEPR